MLWKILQVDVSQRKRKTDKALKKSPGKNILAIFRKKKKIKEPKNNSEKFELCMELIATTEK